MSILCGVTNLMVSSDVYTLALFEEDTNTEAAKISVSAKLTDIGFNVYILITTYFILIKLRVGVYSNVIIVSNKKEASTWSREPV